MRFICGMICATLAGAAGAAAQPVDVERLVERVEPTVLVVTGARADTGARVQGSGCVVHPDGYVLVTAHQVDGVRDMEGRNAGGDLVRLEVVAVDRDADIGLLRADRPLPAADIGDAERLRSGSPLLSVAAPMDLEFSAVTGIVSNPNRTYRGLPVIQTNLPADQGSSGGPVFDRDGRLIGIIMLHIEEAGWVTAVNPINNAYGILERHGVRTRRSPQAPGIAPRQAAARGLGGAEEMLVPAAGVSENEWRAVEAYNRGVFAGAVEDKIAAYRMAVALLPEFYEGWFNLGVAAAAAEELDKAVDAYAAAVRLREDAVEPRRNLGRVYLRMERPADAIRVFERARALAPGHPQSHNDLGEAYRQQGRLEDAITAFETARAIDARYAPARYNLGLTHAQRGDAARAIDELEAYLELAGTAENAQRVRAMINALRE